MAAVSDSDGRVTILETSGGPLGIPAGRGAELISTGAGGIRRLRSLFLLAFWPTCILISVMISPGSKLEFRPLIPTRLRGGGRLMVRKGGKVLKGGWVVVLVVVEVVVVVVVVVVRTPQVRSRKVNESNYDTGNLFFTCFWFSRSFLT